MEILKNGKAADRRRNPLSDRTNSNTLSSSSSSSSFNKPLTKRDSSLIESFLISVFYSRRDTSNKKKAVANPISGKPISKISNIAVKSDGVEVLDLQKIKPLRVPCRKKLHEKDASKDAQLQDFIEKQKAYFEEIDEFKLSEEEVESIYELD
ncbi:uncharacterized protein LOC133317235 [Gastrolobium bilobum]|uniref:uncharacterized protein LOC133317235 n=1 Tax=Gastrolobium bilobum TaxID=150636 RepID=UPI002AB17AC6|nr:uncharacterized protein LOC133317235 [Gastrolobium bilobum]